MSAHIDRTYANVCIPANAIGFEYPPTATDGIRPGALDELNGRPCTIDIKWGINMTDPIEPGTIPDGVRCLMLSETYKHPIDDSMLRPELPLYIHDSNREYGSFNRDYWLWRTDRPFTRAEFDHTDLVALLDPCISSIYQFLSTSPIYIILVAYRSRLRQHIIHEDTAVSALNSRIVELEATVAKLIEAAKPKVWFD